MGAMGRESETLMFLVASHRHRQEHRLNRDEENYQLDRGNDRLAVKSHLWGWSRGRSGEIQLRVSHSHGCFE